jgi:hypothetical protein
MSGKVFLFAAMLLLLMAPSARGESGKALIENSAAFDGKTVTFTGEVVGVLMRGNFAWVNVFDNEVAIGVWCRAEDARKISVIGDYGHVGDTVEVVGTFHTACPEHGGELMIDADNFVVKRAGQGRERPVSLPFAALSVALVFTAIFLAFFLRHIRKEREKIVPWPFQ